MANCFNCGSEHIQINQNLNACLDCGTSWNASELYKNLEAIQSLTNIKLNLSNKNDRITLNDYIIQVTDFKKNIEDIEENYQRCKNNLDREEVRLRGDINISEDKQKIYKPGKSAGCLFIGCFGTFFLIVAAFAGATSISLIIVFVGLLFAAISRLLGKDKYYTEKDEEINSRVSNEHTEERIKISEEYKEKHQIAKEKYMEETEIEKEKFQDYILNFKESFSSYWE